MLLLLWMTEEVKPSSLPEQEAAQVWERERAADVFSDECLFACSGYQGCSSHLPQDSLLADFGGGTGIQGEGVDCVWCIVRGKSEVQARRGVWLERGRR